MLLFVCMYDRVSTMRSNRVAPEVTSPFALEQLFSTFSFPVFLLLYLSDSVAALTLFIFCGSQMLDKMRSARSCSKYYTNLHFFSSYNLLWS